jgi:ETC complex I subunit conserved region
MSEVRILSPRPPQPHSNGVDRTGEPLGVAMMQARIYRPAKTAMQSGRWRTRKWVLEYEPATGRSRDPLMGWTTADDTLNQVQLLFETVDEAKAFAQRQGLGYTVIEPQAVSDKPKSYADNFRYDRVRD